MDAAAAQEQPTTRRPHRVLTENERTEMKRDFRATFNKVVNHPIKFAFHGMWTGYLIPDAINTVGLVAIAPAAIGFSALGGLALGATAAYAVHKATKRGPAPDDEIDDMRTILKTAAENKEKNPLANETKQVKKDVSYVFNRMVNHPIKSAVKGLGLGYLVPDAINTVGLIAIAETVIGLSALGGLAVGGAIAYGVHREAKHFRRLKESAEKSRAREEERASKEPNAPKPEARHTENERRQLQHDVRAAFRKVVNHPIKSAFRGLGLGYLIPDAINTVGLIAIPSAVIGFSALGGLAIGGAIAYGVHKEVTHVRKKHEAAAKAKETSPAETVEVAEAAPAPRKTRPTAINRNTPQRMRAVS